MPHGQIVRDNVPAVDPSEPRTARPWSWVCAALVNRDKGEVRCFGFAKYDFQTASSTWLTAVLSPLQCAVPIVDSVFIDKHKIWAWYYTNSNGIVRRKTPRKLSTEHVIRTFEEIADNPRDTSEGAPHFIAVCWFDDATRNGAPFFTEHELSTFLGSLGPSDGSACLSPVIYPRGDLDPTCYANLEHDYM